MTESVPVSTPLIGLNVDQETAHYIGVLEGTIAALCINEAKYRALLELLTGDPWEETKIDFNGQVLMDIAVSALVKQTNMPLAQAKTLVWKRWNSRNLPTESVVPQAVPIEELTGGVSPDRPLSERFKAWKAKQLAEAENS